MINLKKEEQKNMETLVSTGVSESAELYFDDAFSFCTGDCKIKIQTVWELEYTHPRGIKIGPFYSIFLDDVGDNMSYDFRLNRPFEAFVFWTEDKDDKVLNLVMHPTL